MRFTVRTDQDPEVICRAATLAYLDADVLEVVPVAGLHVLTIEVMQQFEEWAHRELNAWVAWTPHGEGAASMCAEFTPNYGEAAA